MERASLDIPPTRPVSPAVGNPVATTEHGKDGYGVARGVVCGAAAGAILWIAIGSAMVFLLF